MSISSVNCDQAVTDLLEYGLPEDWSNLLAQPSNEALQSTADLLSRINTPEGQAWLKRLAQQDLRHIGAFLASCPALQFFFIGFDRKQGSGVARCGPSQRRILSLMKWRGKFLRPSRQTSGSDRDSRACENTWETVQTILSELDEREGTEYVLYCRLLDDPIPELCHSGGKSPQEAWNELRMTLPAEDREDIPADAPPSELELERAAIKPAPPSIEDPDPNTCSVFCPEFQQHNPFRRPDWRWSRAWAIVRHGRYVSRDRDDPETGRAVRFLRDLLRTPQDTAAIREKYPDLVAANAIYAGQASSRQEIEARILARQSTEEIAGHLSTSDESVETYSDLFFDVCDRLDAGMYVHKQILQPAWQRNAADGLLATLAYHGGPSILEVVLPLLRDGGRELDRLTSESRVQSTWAERLALLLQARQLPNDETTARSLITHFRDVIPKSGGSVEFVNLIGGFAQIVSPFSGELAQTDVPMAIKASRAA